MKSSLLTSALAVLLMVTLIAPSTFLIAPQHAHADLDGVWVIEDTSATNVKTTVESTITAIQSTLSAALDVTNTAAAVAMQINAYVLQPLAFVLSGNLMKALTAAVISFVIGKANGTGAPQFAVDVMMSLQTVSDSQALAYLDQFGRNSNSPFAYSIASSLRTNYLQKTTLAGFWAANMSTLARSSPNVNAFLAGNWSQGGVAAWFALTTQTQNNPYTFYQASQSQLSTLVGTGVGGATGSRLAQLGWGQGFMSWCGASDTTSNPSVVACPAGSYLNTENNKCEYNDGSVATPLSGDQGVNPGDACTNKDGTPGTIKTPGSTIKATLDKVLGGQQDQIVRMGNVGPQINQILGNIATVMQTVQFASQILGGSDSGGLFGVGQASGSNSTSRLVQYQNSSGSLGVTNATVYQGAASIATSGSDMLSRAAQYESAWNTITASANAASTSAASLAVFCTAAADKAALAMTINEFGTQITPQQNLSTIHSVFIDASREQSVAAQFALANVIAPVFARATAASAHIVIARAAAHKLQEQLASGTDAAGSAYSTDMQALQSMPPTMSDVANIQQDVQVFGAATASPPGSLNVSGSSLVDQMNLISTNAATLKTTVCNPASSLYVTTSISG